MGEDDALPPGMTMLSSLSTVFVSLAAQSSVRPTCVLGPKDTEAFKGFRPDD